METTQEFMEKVQPLTQQQRVEARHNARAAVIASVGDKPLREDFATQNFGKYPGWVLGVIVTLIITILITAFIVSAIRLYHIGSLEFYKGIQDEASATVAGIMIVLLSEASAVLFTIALSAIGESRWSRGVMVALAAVATAIALSGNYYVALHGQDATVFSWLDTFAPPVITLGAAFVLERVIFKRIEQRYKDQLEFEQALAVYKELAANPEDHDYFNQAYANALWDKLLDANRDRRRKHEGAAFIDVLGSVERGVKLFLVQREMNADQWYKSPAKEAQEVTQRTPEVVHGVGFLAAAPMPANTINSD